MSSKEGAWPESTSSSSWDTTSSSSWDTTSSSPWEEPELRAPAAWLACVYVCVCVCGVFGNCLVCVAMVRLERLRSSTSVYVMSLALADALFMLSLPLLVAQELLQRWPFGDAACRLVVVLDGMNQFTSAACLTAMSLDRLLATCGPPVAQTWRSPRRAAMLTVLLATVSMTPVLPVAAHFSSQSGVCAPGEELVEGSGGLAFLGGAFCLGFALPLAVMLLSYGALCFRRSRDMMGTNERQVTAMLASVAVAFFVCWAPFYTINFLSVQEVMPSEPWGAGLFITAFQVCVCLSYSWSCCAPLLYAAFSPRFRSHFKTLLCPRKTAHTTRPTHDTHDTHTHVYDLSDSHTQVNELSHTHSHMYDTHITPQQPTQV
ncbi:somatostatin receptor type 5-like [Engraulis encrasicolus]|uniref:somatostatin receptor type 5-like n=1 Tax=Engraulis encrasicolus TaxID=184585 RepID=UPI002FD0FEA9